MQRILSTKLPRNRHEDSVDNFMKSIHKCNQRSERYMSPPMFYMYTRNHTTHTLDKSRSRTLSNRKSHSKARTSKIKHKVDKILQGQSLKSSRKNPALLIQSYGEKLKKLSKYLEPKNDVAHHLCNKFYKVLSHIVDRIVSNLDAQLDEIENKSMRKIESMYIKRLQDLEKANRKMKAKLMENMQKLNGQTELIYRIRMLNQIDVDHIFGRYVLGTDLCGGRGYGHAQSSLTEENPSGRSGQIEDYSMRQEEFYNRFVQQRQYQEPLADRDALEGMGAESGRIKPVEQWSKFKQFPNRHQQFEQDRGAPPSYPIARRLT